MLLIYNNQADLAGLPAAELDAFMAEVDVVMAELTESGELIGGEALADPVQTKTVRVRNGVPAVTDGPFIETKEQFAGYLMIETDRPERAVEIAARWPDASRWAMEVRPVMAAGGLEM
ncbi:YciI family protein [Allocatelliglobosispora scoriae]|nr:YciI family protein [Allocatelliglobosispora scoriae]